VVQASVIGSASRVGSPKGGTDFPGAKERIQRQFTPRRGLRDRDTVNVLEDWENSTR
jgi:hypothetical protein